MAGQGGQPEQIVLMQRMVELATQQMEQSVERTRMSAQRSEMSEMRCYLNAERTLSVWVRTALSLMVFGIAIDRFGLLMHLVPGDSRNPGVDPLLDAFSAWAGMALVVLGVVMVVTTGTRFLAYAHAWRRRHELPTRHGPLLATWFAFMVAVFGVLLLGIMLAFAA